MKSTVNINTLHDTEVWFWIKPRKDPHSLLILNSHSEDIFDAGFLGVFNNPLSMKKVTLHQMIMIIINNDLGRFWRRPMLRYFLSSFIQRLRKPQEMSVRVFNWQVKFWIDDSPYLLLLPGAELSLIAESFGLLNDLLLPFLSILDVSCSIFYIHLANVLFDVILPSVLGSSLWSFGRGFPIKYLFNCSGIWNSLHVIMIPLIHCIIFISHLADTVLFIWKTVLLVKITDIYTKDCLFS